MIALMKDSGLDGLKGTVQFCADCGKPTVHYRVPGGLPICHACGYNPDLAALCARDEQQRRAEVLQFTLRRRAS